MFVSKLIDVAGPSHKPRFTVMVQVGLDGVRGSGKKKMNKTAVFILKV